MAAESLQILQLPHALERLGVQLQRRVGRVRSRASARRLLRLDGVRCRIGSEEELGIARRGRLQQRLAMALAFQYGEAVEVWFDPADEQCVTVVEDVMAGDARLDVGRSAQDVVHRLLRRNVLHDYFQIWHFGHERLYDLVDEDRLAIEDVDGRSADLRVDAQHHPNFGHGPQCRIRLFHVGDASVGIGRGARGVVLARLDETRGVCLADLLRRGIVRQVERHEGLEGSVGQLGWKAGEECISVFDGLFGGRDGWLEIGHGDGSTELLGCVFEDVGHDWALAEVVVEVIGKGERDFGSFWNWNGRACGGFHGRSW
mmetsp:Transcript_36256/g.76180  ORF Transcript_36256/g.76180 Transcript_36256/m.76180 type:complete len:315 (-) Transcript_36256:18-962(-)